MIETLSSEDRAALEGIVRALESGWNTPDSAAFAAPFAEDADFVTVRAEHMKGRAVIAAGHEGIFRSIYAGSSNQYTIESVRAVSAGVALVHVRAALSVPQGPLAGQHGACFSFVATKASGAWEIASFHNTQEPPKR